jgi:hypothetical protein
MSNFIHSPGLNLTAIYSSDGIHRERFQAIRELVRIYVESPAHELSLHTANFAEFEDARSHFHVLANVLGENETAAAKWLDLDQALASINPLSNVQGWVSCGYFDLFRLHGERGHTAATPAVDVGYKLYVSHS